MNLRNLRHLRHLRHLRSSFHVFGALLLVAASGCAAHPSSDDGSSASDLSAAATRPLHVSGDKAERILNAFDLAGATDHAMGGRASVDASALVAVTSANSALDNDDPSYLVPSTTSSFDDAEESPSHREITDPAATASVLFEALAAVDKSLSDSGMGKTWVTVTKVECEGHGPGAGNDPSNPPPTTASCKITSEDNKAYSVDGEKALRIVQAFGLVSKDGVDHAMGGDFGVNAANVSCERRANTALDATDPQFEIPSTSCKADMPDAKPFSVDDAAPVAGAIQKALELAGLQPDSAMGKTGVTATKVSCLRGPGAPTTCTITR